MERKAPTVTLTSAVVRPGEPTDDYPPVTVFGIQASTDDGEWLESFSTGAEVRAFLRGLQAGSQMTGGPYLHLPPEIPTAE